MHILLTIVVTFLCMPWPAMVMMSPMVITSSGFANKKSSIIGTMLFFIYPSGIFLLLSFTGYSFYGTNPLSWAAAAVAGGTFVSLAFRLPQQLYNTWQGISNYDYVIHKNNVYVNGQQIKQADTHTFTHFNNRGYYSKDKNQVYYNTKKLIDADASTFQPLLNDDTKKYWHDKNNVYYTWKRIPKADGASVVYAGNYYATDKDHVFFEDQLLTEADRKTFTVLFGQTGRDANNVFVRAIRAANIKDVKTFRMVFIQEEQFGKDSEQIYVLRYTPSHPLLPFPNADLETFEVLGDYYAKDKNQVYYYSYHIDQIRVLTEADPKTFILYFDSVRNTDATDGSHYYKAGAPREGEVQPKDKLT